MLSGSSTAVIHRPPTYISGEPSLAENICLLTAVRKTEQFPSRIAWRFLFRWMMSQRVSATCSESRTTCRDFALDL